MPEEVEEDSIFENSVCTILTDDLNNFEVYDPENELDIPFLEYLEQFVEEDGPDLENGLISVEQQGQFPYNCCGKLSMEF